MKEDLLDRVLVVGSRCIGNRTPAFLAELSRKAKSFSVFQKAFFLDFIHVRNPITRRICALLGAVIYYTLLPVAVFRSSLVFVPASNNFEILPIAFWSKIFRRPILLDYYVSIYEWSCDLMEILDRRSFIAKLYLLSDKVAYDAEYVIHYNLAEWEHIMELLGKTPRKVFFIPMFTRFDLGVTTTSSPGAGKGVFRFVWWGSNLPLHNLNLIVSAFDRLAETHKGWELHLCFLNKKKQDDFLNSISPVARDWLYPHHKLCMADNSLQSFVAQQADLCFSNFGIGPASEYVYANKVLEAMSVGRSLLMADCLGNRQISGFDEAFFVCKRDINSMVEMLSFVLANRSEVTRRGALCREIFHLHYSESAGASSFGETLLNLRNDSFPT